MPPTHHPAWSLKAGHQSFARWALRPPTGALIFIHGFAGNPRTTFEQFQTLLPGHTKASDFDLAFYGFHGVRARVGTTAALFRQFLQDMGTAPATNVINPTLRPDQRRADAFQYKRLVIVAHSTGAVVSRLALLDAATQGAPWIAKSEMVLFAPAHNGASIAPGTEKNALAGDWQLVVATLFMNFGVPIYQDLLADGKTIRNLTARTTQELAKALPYKGHLVAKKVVFGELDNIVEPATFCEDPPFDVIAGASHTSVCKISSIGDAPFTHLMGAL